MKKALFICFILPLIISAQLLEENFDYVAGTNLTENGWTAHDASGTNPITVNNGGLSYAGYSSSGIGNAALLDNTGEDVHRDFSTVSSGSIYYSFLLNVINPSAGYFIHLSKTSSGSFFAEVFIKTSGSGFVVGTSNTTSATYGTTVFNKLQTYLVIVEYEFLTQKVSVWVKSSGVPATEIDAGTPEVTMTGSGETSASHIALRQYSSSQGIIVDGIRVSTSWNLAPLPVELTDFKVMNLGDKINLTWQTATEINNYGFEIERKTSMNPEWFKIGFEDGFGNSFSPKNYSFIDENPVNGVLTYRLKQIDFDGSFEYSPSVSVEFKSNDEIALLHNYPNPFNPSTRITFELKRSQRLTVLLYNPTGEVVKVLYRNHLFPSGKNRFEMDGRALSSGVYYLVLKGQNLNISKKLIHLK